MKVLKSVAEEDFSLVAPEPVRANSKSSSIKNASLPQSSGSQANASFNKAHYRHLITQQKLPPTVFDDLENTIADGTQGQGFIADAMWFYGQFPLDEAAQLLYAFQAQLQDDGESSFGIA